MHSYEGCKPIFFARKVFGTPYREDFSFVSSTSALEQTTKCKATFLIKTDEIDYKRTPYCNKNADRISKWKNYSFSAFFGTRIFRKNLGSDTIGNRVYSNNVLSVISPRDWSWNFQQWLVTYCHDNSSNSQYGWMSDLRFWVFLVISGR